MSDKDLFEEEPKEQEQPNTEVTPSEPQTDPFVDKLKDIRNENGEQKYRDVPTALEALKSSQQFIEQLKAEKRELEEKYNKTQSELDRMGAIEEYVEKLKPSSATASQPKETPNGDGGLSEERVAQLLEERLSAREKQAMQAANLERVVGKLTETHGDKAAEFIKQRAKELDTTAQALKDLAMSNPTVALTLLGGQPSKPIAPSQSSVIPPRQVQDDNPMPKFEKSVVHGGLTNKQLVEKWKEAKQYTHKRLGVE